MESSTLISTSAGAGAMLFALAAPAGCAQGLFPCAGSECTLTTSGGTIACNCVFISATMTEVTEAECVYETSPPPECLYEMSKATIGIVADPITITGAAGAYELTAGEADELRSACAELAASHDHSGDL